MLLYSCIVCTFTSMILNNIFQYKKKHMVQLKICFPWLQIRRKLILGIPIGSCCSEISEKVSKGPKWHWPGSSNSTPCCSFSCMTYFMTPKLYFNYHMKYFRPLCICLGDLWKGERCCSNIGSGKHLHPRWKEPPEKEDIFLSNKSAHQKIEVSHSDTQDNAGNIDREKVFESQKVELYSVRVNIPQEFDESHCSSTFDLLDLGKRRSIDSIDETMGSLWETEMINFADLPGGISMSNLRKSDEKMKKTWNTWKVCRLAPSSRPHLRRMICDIEGRRGSPVSRDCKRRNKMGFHPDIELIISFRK